MDIISKMEENIALVLATIDGTLQDGGYTYYSKTGTIEIEDEVVSQLTNEENGIDGSEVNYTIEQDTGEDGLDFSVGQNAFTNEIPYLISGKIHLNGDEQYPKRAAKIKMNELLADLKHAFGNNYALNKTCNWFAYAGSNRIYAENNDIIQTGTLEVRFSLNYAQAIYNPDVYACY